MALLYRMGTGNGSGGDLKPYIVQFTCDSGYIGQTLTMTYKGTPHVGEVVEDVSGTVVLDSTDGKGKLTLYPMHSGNWECSCYSSVTGITMKKTIELLYWGTTNVEFNDKPNGATVTPTDDVQTWLHCANIWDKSYTTVTEVIADKTTLNALVQNENANDYLVRSTTFSTTLCENNANNEAMYYLGLYDGCANKLLADDYWREAICNADVLLADGQTHLFEKVLNVKVPTMTSNTAPSGECSGSPTDYTRPAYYAFDKNPSTSYTAYKQVEAYFRYKFPKPVRVNKVMTIGLAPERYSIRASNDGTHWTSFSNVIDGASGTTEQNFNVSNDEYFYYYEIYQTDIITENTYIWVSELQFYGREEA